MKSKGFTLTEVLAVIIILSVIMAMATPMFFSTSNNTRQQLYDSKIEYLRIQTLKFVREQDFEIIDGNSISITVNTLIRSGYITPDKYVMDGNAEIPFVVNPIDSQENLACRIITVTKDGFNYTAKVTSNSNCNLYQN